MTHRLFHRSSLAQAFYHWWTMRLICPVCGKVLRPVAIQWRHIPRKVRR